MRKPPPRTLPLELELVLAGPPPPHKCSKKDVGGKVYHCIGKGLHLLKAIPFHAFYHAEQENREECYLRHRLHEGHRILVRCGDCSPFEGRLGLQVMLLRISCSSAGVKFLR